MHRYAGRKHILWSRSNPIATAINNTMVVANYPQEVSIMKSHIFGVIASERTIEVMHSIELFIATAFIAILVGLAFFAVL
jgi:hypothetical protein